PTLDMLFKVNDSPFVSKEGKPLTSRELRERLDRELHHNVALRVAPGERESEFVVSGRGLLHLGVLLETMRREGSELAVGKPRVIVKEVNGHRHEPFEDLVVEVPNEHVGSVMALVQPRQGECQRMEGHGAATQLGFHIPARGLIGLRTRLMNATNGTAIMHHNFLEYRPMKAALPGRSLGVMVSTETGKATAYAIEDLQNRGSIFVAPMQPVYEGQIVGEHCRDNDLPVNIAREKKLTNFRSATAEIKTVLKQPREFSLEMALEYIEDDELVEITPKSVRMRKVYLNESARKRSERGKV